MNEIQKKLLEILKWFDAFCETHHLKYYAIGGTMLGAVRHKGFIPWDDDIDVGMPRHDYDIFCSLMKDTSCKYVLETIDSRDKKFLYMVSKLYDTETTCIEKTKQKLIRGVWLDIFPIDGLGKDFETAKRHIKKINKLNLILSTRMSTIRKERAFLKNCAIFFSSCIPNFIFKPNKIQQKIEKLRKQYSFDDSDYCGNLISHYGEKEIIEKEAWGTPLKYQFEDGYIYGVEKPELYFSHLFKNWRELPPENKRKSGHDIIYLNLSKSYLDFKIINNDQ